jgi:hypothetical protein
VELEGDVVAGKPHQPGEPLALGYHRLPRPRQVRDRLGMEDLLPHPVQPGVVTRRLHAARKLGGRLGHEQHLLQVSHTFLRRDCVEPRLAGLGGDIEHLRRHRKLHLLEAAALDPGPQGNGQEIDDREGQRPFDLALAAFRRPQICEVRVRHPAGLHEVGLGDAQLGIGRLQTGVIKEGDLHSVVGG